MGACKVKTKQVLIDQAKYRTPHYVAQKYKTHQRMLPQFVALQAVAADKFRVARNGLLQGIKPKLLCNFAEWCGIARCPSPGP